MMADGFDFWVMDEVFEDILFKDVPKMSVLFFVLASLRAFVPDWPFVSTHAMKLHVAVFFHVVLKCRGPVLDYVHHRCIFVNSCIGILMMMMMMMMVMVMLLVVAVAAAPAVVVVFAGNDGCKFSNDGHCHWLLHHSQLFQLYYVDTSWESQGIPPPNAHLPKKQGPLITPS